MAAAPLTHLRHYRPLQDLHDAEGDPPRCVLLEQYITSSVAVGSPGKAAEFHDLGFGDE